MSFVQRIWFAAISFSCLIIGILPLTAIANTLRPEVDGCCQVLANNCELIEKDSVWKIKLRHTKNSFDAPVDLYWLAGWLSPGSTCTVEHQKRMELAEEYLRKLQTSIHYKELLVTLVHVPTDAHWWKKYADKWVVSGIWVFTPEQCLRRLRHTARNQDTDPGYLS